MITTITRRVVPLAALAVVLGAIVRIQHVPVVVSDVWFHLRFGQEFLSDSWTVRDPGHLGVFDSAEWVPTQWLPQIGMAWLHEQLGIGGVIFSGGVLQLSLALLTYVVGRRLTSPLPAALAASVAMMAASPGLTARPQLFSYLLVVATTYAWLATARDGRARWWVVGLAWTWPMLHGMWPVGISISVVAFVGVALQREVHGRQLLQLGMIPVLSCAVAILNPLGPSALRSLFDVGSRASYFSEWGPADFTEPAAALLAVMIAVVLMSGLRSAPDHWVHVLLAMLGLAWALYSVRTTPVAALILAPLLATAIQRVVPESGPLERHESAALLAMFLVAVTSLGLLATSRASEAVVPDWVDNRLDALAPGAKVLNDWPSGAYVLAAHPDLDLVMHGYGDVFTESELARNASLVRLEPGWDRLVAEVDADAALLDPGSALGYAVEHQLGWTRIQGDEEFVLLVPPAG